MLQVLGISVEHWDLTFAEDTTEQDWPHGNSLELFENSETSFSIWRLQKTQLIRPDNLCNTFRILKKFLTATHSFMGPCVKILELYNNSSCARPQTPQSSWNGSALSHLNQPSTTGCSGLGSPIFSTSPFSVIDLAILIAAISCREVDRTWTL